MFTNQNTQQADESNSNTNANGTPNSNYTNVEIENTPFRLIGKEEIGYIITLGKYKLTTEKDTEAEALDELENNKWNIIFRLIGTMLQLDNDSLKKD